METSKLMTPLFHDGNFNREGRKMRAVFEREISDGTTTYRLWRSAGKPDLDYPRTENDKYILHVEINGYLVPLGMTDCALVDHCGFESAANKLYGGKVYRGKWIDGLRASGGIDAVNAAVAEERAETERYGADPVRQTGYIREILNDHVGIYLKAKENGGQSFPDFVGALVLNDLAKCVELSTAYKALKREEQRVRVARAEEEDKAFCEKQNTKAEQAVAAALQIIREGGVLENETVKFYRSRYDASAYSIVNYLMRLYQVNVPLRTQGWINDKLSNVTIRDGGCTSLQYFRSKNGRVSQKFFECMDDLIRAVMKQASENEEAA